ncbi:transferase [Pseudodesulfovibrio cashew]|uniref:Transferase n=1 Tax=Pseudodesulfovibrio cashew TaxID=2678688 RepID=A0A6I6JE97_9BACT|nr:acetyltransferase [Pseudodesulfovibrio cashew]QGY39338.1 transferase [Pseudodesulfovibrio cashew]
MKILIFGNGGHAKVVADILLDASGMDPIGFLAPEEGTPLLGLPFLGDAGQAAMTPHDGAVVAIGDNRARRTVYLDCLAKGMTLTSAIHPSAVIGREVTIEPGCMICAGAVINSGATIRANTILNTGCTVDHDCVVGPHAHVAPGVNLAGTVTVGEGVFLGIGTSVIQGIEIGAWAIAGAGAAIIENVRPEAVVVGVPARELTKRTPRERH